jgi:hypothetical protein
VIAALHNWDRTAAFRRACRLRDLFGAGNVWIELQQHLRKGDAALTEIWCRWYGISSLAMWPPITHIMEGEDRESAIRAGILGRQHRRSRAFLPFTTINI